MLLKRPIRQLRRRTRRDQNRQTQRDPLIYQKPALNRRRPPRSHLKVSVRDGVSQASQVRSKFWMLGCEIEDRLNIAELVPGVVADASKLDRVDRSPLE